MFFREIALNGGPYIDIIVGGHSHSLLYNDEVPVHSAFVPEGSYPTVVDRPDKKVSFICADIFILCIVRITGTYEKSKEW